MAEGRTKLIWRDGELVKWEDATVHVMSHAIHYGAGIFEGIRCYETPSGPAVFRLPEHIRRLVDSCKIYRIPLDYTAEQLVQATVETVAANELRHCYLRPLVIRTGEQMGINPIGVKVETFVIAWNWGAYLGKDALEQGVDVAVSSWRRAAPDTVPMMAKASGNYQQSQLAKLEAKMNKYGEGIMLDVHGYVAEGSGENLFLVRDGVVYTSPVASAILGGITRHSVMTIAREMGLTVREEVIPREMLYMADEVFFTGTAVEVTPIRSIDQIQVGAGRPGPITRQIQQTYLDIAHGRQPDRHGWLTMVPEAATLSR
ncbi:MAG: branched-chain amino acid transaminase [Gemmatimonadetes bacterium]|nr:branched-chain amino acid transaminase [Gemmatimonadota bacterium]